MANGSCCMCAGCYGVGYSGSVVEIPSSTTASSGYDEITGGYSSEYVITDAVTNSFTVTQQYQSSVDATSQYHAGLPAGVDTSSHYHSGVDTSSEAAAALLTYASHYTPATPMMSTVPYCAPLVADPYIVQHEGVSYPHQVLVISFCIVFVIL